MLAEIGFVDIRIGEPVDTFGEAGGGKKARQVAGVGHPFPSP